MKHVVILQWLCFWSIHTFSEWFLSNQFKNTRINSLWLPDFKNFAILSSFRLLICMCNNLFWECKQYKRPFYFLSQLKETKKRSISFSSLYWPDHPIASRDLYHYHLLTQLQIGPSTTTTFQGYTNTPIKQSKRHKIQRMTERKRHQKKAKIEEKCKQTKTCYGMTKRQLRKS